MANKVPVADRYLRATHDNWGKRATKARAFVIHMAEGFNVAQYLAGNNVGRGVSVHFTIEKDGTIFQQLDLDEVSASINPGTLRRDNDKGNTFGVSHAQRALDDWWSNPNHAVITVEVAGFAHEGPNDTQVDSIVKLFNYLKKRYPGIIPLGHRDFQNVKACPGVKMYNKGFAAIGGHGNDYDPSDEGRGRDAMIVTGEENDRLVSSRVVRLPEGTKIFERPGDSESIWQTPAEGLYEYVGRPRGEQEWWAIQFRGPARLFGDGVRRWAVGYIKRRDSFQLEANPDVDAPQPIPTNARIKQLESALQEIRVQEDTITSAASEVENIAVEALSP